MQLHGSSLLCRWILSLPVLVSLPRGVISAQRTRSWVSVLIFAGIGRQISFLSVKSGCIVRFECHLGLLSDVPFAWRSGIHTSIEMFAQYFCSMPAVLTCLFKIFNKIHTGYWFTIAIPYRLTGRKLNLKIVLIRTKMNCIKSIVLHFCSCHRSVYRIIYASSALHRLLAIIA